MPKRNESADLLFKLAGGDLDVVLRAITESARPRPVTYRSGFLWHKKITRYERQASYLEVGLRILHKRNMLGFVLNHMPELANDCKKLGITVAT